MMKRLAAIAVIGAVIGGAGAIYVMRGPGGNAPPADCAATTASQAALKPLARGQVAGVLVHDRPRALPDLSYLGPDGAPARLADLRGKTVLLNMWATWCVPCREEMPALDSLQAQLGGPDFEVLAVSLDTQGVDRARDFLSEIGVGHLTFRIDPSGRLFQELKKVGRGVGLPTSLLIDAKGCEIAYLPGPADWASEDARALVQAAVKGTARGS